MFKYFHKGFQYLNFFGGTSKKKHPADKNWGLPLTEHPVVANFASRRATEKIFYTKIIRI